LVVINPANNTKNIKEGISASEAKKFEIDLVLLY